MNVRELCFEIEVWDYIDYREFLYDTFGDKAKRFMMSKQRYFRHQMMDLAIETIMNGEY